MRGAPARARAAAAIRAAGVAAARAPSSRSRTSSFNENALPAASGSSRAIRSRCSRAMQSTRSAPAAMPGRSRVAI